MAEKKQTRRGHNEGSIYKRADGKWIAAISLAIQGGGLKRKCKVGNTRKETKGK